METKTKEVKILLCGLESKQDNSSTGKCDFCGVTVSFKTVEKFDKKICPHCFLKQKNLNISEFRLTKEAEKILKNKLKPKMVAMSITL